MEKRERKQHESFGLARFSRRTGGSQALFGSSIKHGETITLTIMHGEVDRHLEQDWYGDTGVPIVEVTMSQTQFAELITSLNVGVGVPVTIEYLDGKRMEPCPFESKQELHSKEFKQRMVDYGEKVDKLQKEAYELIAKKLSKKDQEEFRHKFESLVTEIKSNIPFYEKQFVRQTDKTVTEAKGTFDAFLQTRISLAGMKALGMSDEDKPDIKLIEE